jgi:hypothetical protein
MALFNQLLVAGECRPSLLRRQLTRTVRVEIKFTRPTNRNVARATRSRTHAVDAMHASPLRLYGFLLVSRESIVRQAARSIFLSDGAVASHASRLCLCLLSKERERGVEVESPQAGVHARHARNLAVRSGRRSIDRLSHGSYSYLK